MNSNRVAEIGSLLGATPVGLAVAAVVGLVAGVWERSLRGPAWWSRWPTSATVASTGRRRTPTRGAAARRDPRPRAGADPQLPVGPRRHRGGRVRRRLPPAGRPAASGARRDWWRSWSWSRCRCSSRSPGSTRARTISPTSPPAWPTARSGCSSSSPCSGSRPAGRRVTRSGRGLRDPPVPHRRPRGRPRPDPRLRRVRRRPGRRAAAAVRAARDRGDRDHRDRRRQRRRPAGRARRPAARRRPVAAPARLAAGTAART